MEALKGQAKGKHRCIQGNETKKVIEKLWTPLLSPKSNIDHREPRPRTFDLGPNCKQGPDCFS